MVRSVSVDERKQRLTLQCVGINNTIKKECVPKRTAGRPAKAASEKRNVIFRFVVTAAEEKRLRAKAKELGLSISEYLRSVAIPKE